MPKTETEAQEILSLALLQEITKESDGTWKGFLQVGPLPYYVQIALGTREQTDQQIRGGKRLAIKKDRTAVIVVNSEWGIRVIKFSESHDGQDFTLTGYTPRRDGVLEETVHCRKHLVHLGIKGPNIEPRRLTDHDISPLRSRIYELSTVGNLDQIVQESQKLAGAFRATLSAPQVSEPQAALV